MSNIDTPAFPASDRAFSGMTLRDYFAAKSMDGFNKRMIDYGWSDITLSEFAQQAYRIADAMLEARKL